MRLRIKTSDDPIILFLRFLLGVAFGLPEIQDIAGFVIFDRQGRFHATCPREGWCPDYWIVKSYAIVSCASLWRSTCLLFSHHCIFHISY
jgi:hypothetical protein